MNIFFMDGKKSSNLHNNWFGNGGEKAKTPLEKLHWYEFAILREKLMATAFIHLALL